MCTIMGAAATAFPVRVQLAKLPPCCVNVEALGQFEVFTSRLNRDNDHPRVSTVQRACLIVQYLPGGGSSSSWANALGEGQHFSRLHQQTAAQDVYGSICL
jgi:hypothetical protein